MKEISKIMRKSLPRLSSEELMRAYDQIQSISEDIGASKMVIQCLCKTILECKHLNNHELHELLNKLLKTLKIEFDPDNLVFDNYEEAMKLANYNALTNRHNEEQKSINNEERSIKNQESVLSNKYKIINHKLNLLSHQKFYLSFVKMFYNSKFIEDEPIIKYDDL